MMTLPFHSPLFTSVQHEVERNRDLFGRSIRVKHTGSAHRETMDLLLRVPVGYPDRPLHELYNELECEWDYSMIKQFGMTVALVDDIFEWLDGQQLGRVILAALGRRKHIYPHVDEGLVPQFYKRYHLVITTGVDCLFIVENEVLTMEAGMLFNPDVRRTHAAVNLGTQERINLIMDIR